MRISSERLLAEAGSTGFRPEMLEKVIHLLTLLEGFESHPFLKGKLALKGGTALNLFVFELPRLSVDIDVNYIGAADREAMLAERPKIETAIQAVCEREGMAVTRLPQDHAGGKWRLRYDGALSERGNLEIDLNFLLRTPLWLPQRRDSRDVGTFRAEGVLTLDVHELAAGKLAALLARHASRDLFDSHLLLTKEQLDRSRLRLAFVLYGAMNRRDWRTVSTDDVQFEAKELRDQLIPTVRTEYLPSLGDIDSWATTLTDECRSGLAAVLPLVEAEREFMDRLLDHGEIAPSLLTDDEEMAGCIAAHPGLLWKALNVREHKGRGYSGAPSG